MKCKFCSAEIGKNVKVCPKCRRVLKKNGKKRGMKLVLSATGLALLAAILVGVVLQFTGVIDVTKWFREQDIFYKKSYSARLAKVERKGNKVVAKLGDQELTNGELQVYYWSAAHDFIRYYGEEFAKHIGLDAAKPLDEQIFDETTGMTYQQLFLEQGLKTWSRTAILVQMANEAGYQLNAEEQAQIDAFPETLRQQAKEEGFDDPEAYVDEYFPGSSVEAYIKYNANLQMANQYFNVLSDSQWPTAPEMEAYYTQNEVFFQQNKIAKEDGMYHSIRQIYIPVVGDIGDVQGKPTYTQKEWDECLPKAQKVLNDYTAAGGGEELFIQFVDEVCYTDYKANGGLRTMLTKHTEIPTNLEESFSAEFKEWYLSPDRKPGDVGMVKDDEGDIQGYQILYYCGSEPIWELETKNKMHDERVDATMKQAETQYPMAVKYSKIFLGGREATVSTQPTQ